MGSSPQFLPDILLLEIFSWLPAATVLQLRCVSKSINSETRAPLFVLCHLSRLKRQQEREGSPPRLLSYREYGRARTQLLPEPQPPPRPGVPRELRKKALKHHKCVAAVNGLLLVKTINNFFSNEAVPQPRMLICNPLTGDCTRLPQQDTYPCWVEMGFAPGTEEYKVLCLSRRRSLEDWEIELFFEVCAMPAGSGVPGHWRKISGLPPPHMEDHSNTPAAVVNGRIHLIGKSTPYSSAERTIITSFDISDEAFREVPVPALTSSSSIRQYDVKLANLGGSLSLLQIEKTDQYRSCRHRLLVWVMKEYGDGKSWVKAFFFEARQPPSTPIADKHKYCVSTTCLDENGELVCYDVVERRYNPVRGGLGVKFGIFGFAIPFIGTLVAPKLLEGDHFY